MNKTTNLIFLLFFMLIAGMLFFLCQKEFIIFKFPAFNNNYREQKVNSKISKTKKNIKLYYWMHERWKTEDINIIWSENINENIQYTISAWLNLLEEERIIDKKVTLQSALMSENNQFVYLSFDRPLFNEENSTNSKLMIIESLLKTLRDNGIKIQGIIFLIHHQEMPDPHLDFSHPWSLQGFKNI